MRKQTIDKYADGKIDRSEYVKQCRQYDDQLMNLKMTKTKLLEQIPTLHKSEVVDASIRRYSESVKTRLLICADNNSKREFLKDYIREVIYDNTSVTIIGSIPVKLKAYHDPDQSSDASKIESKIAGKIKRGNKWMHREQ